MTDIKLPPSRSPAMDKVEQRAWELLEAECGKPLPFDVPTHAALSAIRAALAQQPAADPRSTHRVWRGDDWQPCYCEATNDHRIGSEQPVAVDDMVVERIAALLHEEATAEPWTVAGVEHPGPDRDYYRGLARKVAALVTQPGGSDNGR